MFDEEEQKLLSQALNKARKECQYCMNVYDVSGFDECFDAQLKKLVLIYNFDFEAVALHLYFTFPQYGHRLAPQAVSYRWYQLVLDREGNQIQQKFQEFKAFKRQTSDQIPSEEKQTFEEENNEVIFYDLNNKLKQYEIAMAKAQELDEEEEKNFMIYKPKFIIDSEFRLERETADNSQHLCAMLENEVSWEFGSFQLPQSGPQSYSFEDSSKKECPVRKNSDSEEETYLEDDWEAYESD